MPRTPSTKTAPSTEQPTTMLPVLGLPSVLAYGLSAIGLFAVFTVYGTGARLSEDHLPAAYVVALGAMLLTAHSYARMASRFPRSGSAYMYSRKSFGPTVGFFTGWLMLLDYLFLPMVNFLLIGLYLNSVFDGIPAWAFTLAAILGSLTLTVVGVAWVGKFNIAITIGKVLVAVAFIILAVTHADSLTIDSFIAPLLPENGSLGAIMSTAAVLSFAFIGFDGVSTLAEETKNPRKTIPRAIMLSTLVAGVTFIVISWAGYLLFPDWTVLAKPDAAGTEMMLQAGGTVLMSAFLLLYVPGTLFCGVAAQMSVSRVLFSMSRDGLMPRAMAKLHRRFRTPWVASVAVAAVSLVALFITLDQAVYMINFGALFAFFMVNLAALKVFWFDLKERDGIHWLRNLVLPLAGLLIIGYLWTQLALFTFILGAIWLVVGVSVLAWRTSFFRNAPPALELDAPVADDSDAR